MKIGILTFHASHNFGSMLQAYALKTYLSQENNDVEIINFRTENQKDIYAVLTKRKGFKYILKNLYSLSKYYYLKKKYDLFEDFLKIELECEQELTTAEQINEQNFDVIIAGSDQIWNISTNDFEWIYFLENLSAKKYSYAASCGPISVDPQNQVRLYGDLEKFEAISVRDYSTKQFVENNSNQKAVIVCDPVMLLDKNTWITLGQQASKCNLPDKYIFFYTLSCDNRMKKIVIQLSKKLNLPIVVPHNTNQNDLFMPAKRILVSGPKEFLHLIRHATIVVTSSFHAMQFSLIYNKIFYLIDGMKDNRKRDILNRYHLERQSIDSEQIDIQFVRNQIECGKIDFSDIIQDMQASGRNFLNGRILHGNM